MKLGLAVLIFAGGAVLSLLAAFIVAFVYQELAGTHPDVLGFEDISELSDGQKHVQLVLAVATFAAGLFLTYLGIRRVLRAPAVSQ
jgi:hypothetical protein